MLCSWALSTWREWGSVTSWPLTFATCPPLAWQRPSSQVQSGGGPRWHSLAGRSVCVRLLIVCRWNCSTHTESGLCDGCGGMSLTSLCAFWLLLALFPVGFRWSVKLSWRMGLLEEQDSAVVGGSSLPAQLPVYWVYQVHTSPAWEWLGIFYLLHVVYKVISDPPPISLVLCRKN